MLQIVELPVVHGILLIGDIFLKISAMVMPSILCVLNLMGRKCSTTSLMICCFVCMFATSLHCFFFNSLLITVACFTSFIRFRLRNNIEIGYQFHPQLWITNHNIGLRSYLLRFHRFQRMSASPRIACMIKHGYQNHQRQTKQALHVWSNHSTKLMQVALPLQTLHTCMHVIKFSWTTLTASNSSNGY